MSKWKRNHPSRVFYRRKRRLSSRVTMMTIRPIEQRRQLGEFVRAHRERLDPAAFGLAAGRRRTPGLRREEVAQLCGLSATWYTLPQKLVTENYRGWSMHLSHRR